MIEYIFMYVPRTFFVMLLRESGKISFIKEKIEAAMRGGARGKIVIYTDIAQNLHLAHRGNRNYEDLFNWASGKLTEWDWPTAGAQ
jgi:hypothetical protein